ncbi:uncharacterized protein LOC122817618 [Protopterus annectens]|uniref:uncharacterized protein LOC122817618 n=1 Tax=Protopterus annectens TaxID=7888 RepID=UPI001CFC076F|nr:uncharacterized protein LOC122817618 [Protopterus annectens]
MEPSERKWIAHILGFLSILLFLTATVTVTLAVLVWNSDAIQKWKDCRNKLHNETIMLRTKLLTLEKEYKHLRREWEQCLQREEDLRLQLREFQNNYRNVNGTLVSCWNHVHMLKEKTLVLEVELSRSLNETSKMNQTNSILNGEVAHLKQKFAATQRDLNGYKECYSRIVESWKSAKAARDQCEASRTELQNNLLQRCYRIDLQEEDLGPCREAASYLASCWEQNEMK